MSPTTSKPTLHAKIATVQAALKGIGLSGKVNTGAFSYEYVTESDLMARLLPLLSEQKIAIYIDYPPQYVNIMQNAASVVARIQLIDGDTGETIELHTPGYAVDKQDKAIQKAMTGATRYALWKGFCIPAIAGFDDDEQSFEVQTTKPQQAASTGAAHSKASGADKATPAPPVDAASRVRHSLELLRQTNPEAADRLKAAIIADIETYEPDSDGSVLAPTTLGAWAKLIAEEYGAQANLDMLLTRLEKKHANGARDRMKTTSVLGSGIEDANQTALDEIAAETFSAP